MEPFLDDGWIAAYLYETSSSEVGNLANLPRESGSGDGRAGGRRHASMASILLINIKKGRVNPLKVSRLHPQWVACGAASLACSWFSGGLLSSADLREGGWRTVPESSWGYWCLVPGRSLVRDRRQHKSGLLRRYAK